MEFAKKILLILIAGLIAFSSALGTYFLMHKNLPSQKASIKNINTGKTTSFETNLQKAKSAVVYIRAYYEDSVAEDLPRHFFIKYPKNAYKIGSGVLLSSDGYIITNYHVINNTRFHKVILDNHTEYFAQKVGVAEDLDLAVLKIEGKKFPFLNIANSDSAQIGENVYAVGNPLTLVSTVTSGIICAKNRVLNIIPAENRVESFLQTDATLNPGNSGGALINSNGDLLGINTAILTNTGKFAGYSFAIPSNLVKCAYNQIKKDSTFKHIRLDCQLTDINRKMYQNPTQPAGVLVELIFFGGLAQNSDLEMDDIIIGANHLKIQSTGELYEFLALQKKGKTILLQVWRKGKIHNIFLNKNGDEFFSETYNMTLPGCESCTVKSVSKFEQLKNDFPSGFKIYCPPNQSYSNIIAHKISGNTLHHKLFSIQAKKHTEVSCFNIKKRQYFKLQVKASVINQLVQKTK